MTSARVATAVTCGRCEGAIKGAVYEVRAGKEKVTRCLRCALYGSLVRRSLLVCLAVGTVLVTINQGNVIVRGDFPMALAWKIPLT